MKRRILILFFAFMTIVQLKAQISEGGLPPSFGHDSSLRSEVAPIAIPVNFNVEDLLLVDEWQTLNGSPLRVAKSIPVDLNMENAGSWSVLSDGTRICQLRIQAEGAIALMLYYKTFDIPEGGKLFIYNADKTQVLGAYTNKTNPRKDYFATEFVAGDDLVLEFLPGASGEQPRIEIEEIGYGYNHLSVVSEGGLRSSGSCMVNINCAEGVAWQKEKAGICRTVQKIGDNSYICSGSLMNNTAQNFKPYILMAYHCMEEVKTRTDVKVSSSDDMKQWMFYFNYERLGCSTSSPAVAKTMTGCTKVASSPMDGGSDGLLLLLDQEVPESYNVYYNGWDRRNTIPQSGVNIHHPGGDYKKISTYTTKGEHTTWNGSNSQVGARSAHWNVIFAETENGYGVTEGGSSGSPLFNQDHLVVGTLSGGTSSCEEPDGANLYGKLYYHWNRYSLADTARMDKWLDPAGTDVETLQGLSRTTTKPKPTDLQITYKNKEVSLAWTAPVSTETPKHYNIYRTNQLIGTSTKANYTDANLSLLGEIVYGVSAEYANGDESLPLSGSIYIQEYKTPSDLVTNAIEDDVALSWAAPLFEQTISWSTSDPEVLLGADAPVYFGHAWEPDDLQGINNNTLTAVEFYAAKDAVYSLLLIQGERTYKQSISSPSVSGIISVDLTTPFVIDATEELIVSVYTYSTKSDVGTIACDAGSAVIGKGNLISENATEWFVLYNGAEDSDEEYDFNFYLGAVVSSSKGVLTKLKSSREVAINTQQNSTVSLKKTSYTGSNLRSVTSRSAQFQYPSAFPVIEGYNVYRNSKLLTTTPVIDVTYTDKQAPAGTYVYGVSSVYSTGESEQTFSSSIAVSTIQLQPDAITLSPTPFDDYIRVANSYKVNRLEIYSISGVLVRSVINPGEYINTSFLSSGVYIFRLYTQDEIKTIQTIKK